MKNLTYVSIDFLSTYSETLRLPTQAAKQIDQTPYFTGLLCASLTGNASSPPISTGHVSFLYNQSQMLGGAGAEWEPRRRNRFSSDARHGPGAEPPVLCDHMEGHT